ncbi:MAG TPA: hypothetical protein VG847_01930 [Chitinophagaceae bacterium]|nr:hypothetical protein [Chitinophagaceae bacterium]
MERKIFLKSGLSTLGLVMVAPLLNSCKKEDVSSSSSSGSNSDSSGSCTDTPVETAGPYPTHTPSSLVASNIVSDRTGVALTIKITINNSNNSCATLSGAIVDIWHCDALGNYSEYGGSGTSQSSDYTSVHFLRGRQTTDSSGLVTFTSIFPGWYSGRAPHIHVHVYSADGSSLLITQIAFPTDICNTVYTTASPYNTRGTQDTSNTSDSVFSDSLAYELATVEGSVSDGYALTQLITVSA